MSESRFEAESTQAESLQAQTQAESLWDGWATHRELLRLTIVRTGFRFRRMMGRFLSPRRIIASVLAVAFLVLYVLTGVLVLSTREPADPGRLQLWLSGGMVLYAIYHATKCAWTSASLDLDLTASEDWLLGGGPVKRSSLAIYHVLQIVPATMTKTLLLAVVLVVDVHHPWLLILGVFTSLVMLEVCRLTVTRMAGGLNSRGLTIFRTVTTCLAAAIVLQIIARVIAIVPLGSPTPIYLNHAFEALGQTAASPAVQWLSLPWHAAANLAVTETLGAGTTLYLAGSLLLLPTCVLAFVFIDRHCLRAQMRIEETNLRSGNYTNVTRKSLAASNVHTNARTAASLLARLLNRLNVDASSIASRIAVSVSRYRGTIGFSFVIPSILCLSPLLSSRLDHPWIFVVGGIGMCTSLIAPSALRLDFRRDLSRMLLLRSLPVSSSSMVLGQLWFPVVITCAFQWFVLAIAASVLRPGWYQLFMYGGMLAALSVFTFAIENALFLAYPHREKAEGIGMLVRTKLTFLGKTSVVVGAFILLAVWVTFCKSMFPESLFPAAVIGGALAVTWAMAGLAFAATTWCWRRFDLSSEWGL